MLQLVIKPNHHKTALTKKVESNGNIHEKFIVTMKWQLRLDVYPLSRMEEMFESLSGKNMYL